ncbi:MAG: hypothetical protein HY704_04545 [Gemmatimonadetes bacterium]|nr:hypothetical protein [Gemmatimonadota bacterium]
MLGNLFPGGYVFSTIVIWTVIGLVLVGTNLVPIFLTIGALLMAYETVTGRR